MKKIENPETVTPRAIAVSFAEWVTAKGFDLDPVAVELVWRFHSEWQSSPERVSERESAKIARAAAAEKAKKDREAARAARLLEERAKLEAKLAKLGSIPADSPDEE